VIRFRGPVRRSGDGFVIDVGDEERALLRRLMGELRELLTAEDPDPLVLRLFPPAHPDDPELEAEYQRLMREELVASRLASLDAVEEALDRGGRLDEGSLSAFMRSVNAVRLVLGTMLGVSDDPLLPEVTPGLEDSAEYHLYAFLSWVLEHTVQALSGR
jgi:hypothetical protein